MELTFQHSAASMLAPQSIPKRHPSRHHPALVWHTAAGAPRLPGSAAPAETSLLLQPVSIPLGTASALNLTAAITSSEYTLTVAGTAAPEALLLPARYLPQLGDGLDSVLPFPLTRLQTARVDFSCVHPGADCRRVRRFVRRFPPAGRRG